MHSLAGSVKYPHGQGCVAFLRCHTLSQKASEYGIPESPEDHRRPPQKEATRSEAVSEGCRQGHRGGYPHHLQLGEQFNESAALSSAQDIRFSQVQSTKRQHNQHW